MSRHGRRFPIKAHLPRPLIYSWLYGRPGAIVFDWGTRLKHKMTDYSARLKHQLTFGSNPEN